MSWSSPPGRMRQTGSQKLSHAGAHCALCLNWSPGQAALSGLDSAIFILGAHGPRVQAPHLSAKELLQGVCSTDRMKQGCAFKSELQLLQSSTWTGVSAHTVPLQPAPNISTHRPDDKIIFSKDSQKWESLKCNQEFTRMLQLQC